MKHLIAFFLLPAILGCKNEVGNSLLNEQDGAELPLIELMDSVNRSTIKLAVSEVAAGAHIVDCAKSSNIYENTKFITESLKGFILDGAGGDLCIVKDGIYYCGQESLRAAMSMNPLGRWLLRQKRVKTTEQVVYQGAKATLDYSQKAATFISEYGDDMAKYMYRLQTDPAYRMAQVIKIYTVLALSGSQVLDEVTRTDCATIRDQFARVMGLVSYEITLTVGFAIITAEIGGVGATAKVGALLAKLNRIAVNNNNISNLINKIVSGLSNVADKIMDFRLGKTISKGTDATSSAWRSKKLLCLTDCLSLGEVFDFLTVKGGYKGHEYKTLEYFAVAADPQNADLRDALGLGRKDIFHTYSVIEKGLGPVNGKQLGRLTDAMVEANPDKYIKLYHGTLRSTADDIIENGIDISRGNGEFGNGFYTTSSSVQAKEWAMLKNNTDLTQAGVIEIVIKKSELDRLMDNKYLSFPQEHLSTSAEYAEAAPLFDNFVKSNQLLRKQGQASAASDGIDLVAGPSISSRKGVFDQLRFGNTDAVQRLFSADNDSFMARVVE